MKPFKSAKMVLLKGGLEDVNTADKQDNIVPTVFMLEGVSNKFSCTFPAYSYTIIEINGAKF